jgi:hypothetical protein
MKHFYIGVIQCLILTIVAVSAQERISVLDGELFFSIPSEVIRFKPYSEFSSYAEAERYHENKISIWISATDGNAITSQNWRLSEAMENLVQKRRVTGNDFLELLNKSQNKLAFSDSNGPFIIAANHSGIKYNGVLIGELCGYDGSQDIVAPNFHGYSIKLVVGDAIVTIAIRLHDPNRNFAKQMPEYFYFDAKSYNSYIWRDFTQKRDVLYQKLNADDYSGLPVEFRKVRKTVDSILNTMVIQSYEKVQFYKTEAPLRLRTNATVSGEVITTIPPNSQVKLLEEADVQIISGIAAKWVKIETNDGKQGWCFSGYLGR